MPWTPRDLPCKEAEQQEHPAVGLRTLKPLNKALGLFMWVTRELMTDGMES